MELFFYFLFLPDKQTSSQFIETVQIFLEYVLIIIFWQVNSCQKPIMSFCLAHLQVLYTKGKISGY